MIRRIFFKIVIIAFGISKLEICNLNSCPPWNLFSCIGENAAFNEMEFPSKI